MTDAIQLGLGFGRGQTWRGAQGPWSRRADGFGPVLAVQQVFLDQLGLNKPHSTVCVAGCGNILHGEGVPQSSSRGQFVCSLVTMCFQW